MDNKKISGKEVRKVIKTEIAHFKDMPEILDFEAVKVSKNDGAYGIMWGRLVRDYLKTAYSGETAEAEIASEGVTYKVLKCREVTAFYDVDGNTLFDVENKRLEREYGRLMNSGVVDAAEGMDAGEENGEDERGDSVVEQTEEDPEAGEAPPTGRAEAEEEDITDNGANDDVIPMGTASLKEIVTGVPAPAAEEIAAAEEENAKPAKQRAKEKLEKERESAKDSTFADPIIEYLLKRCNEDEGMAEDVVQEHKTWKKCFDYIYSRAREQAKGNCAAVRDDVVYEWAEDYYHKDDKAEEEEKARKEAGRKEKQKKAAAERAAKAKKKSSEAVTAPEKKADAPKEQPKPKKNNRDMDGQLDMFSMMGM